MSSREIWIDRYATRMMTRSDSDNAFARECAAVAADEQVEAWGDDVAEWESPEDAADEEMTCWDCEPSEDSP